MRDAARILGVCAATVYKLCAHGALGHVRILNAIRIPPAEIQDLLSQGPKGT